MKDLVKFEFQGKGVRTVVIEGEPWFVAKDVCDVLELGNITEALRGLDADELTSEILKSGGQGREMRLVNESGLYALIFKSRKPQAKAFRKWVTSEVLPQIRKTGKYEARPQAPTLPTLPGEIVSREFEALHRMASIFGFEGNQAILCADKAVRKLHGISPVALLEVDLKSPDNEAFIIATEIGKRFDPPKSAKFINLTLADLGFQKKVERKTNKFEWRLTEKGKGYGMYVDVGKSHSDGTPIQQIKWKESVISMIAKYLDI